MRSRIILIGSYLFFFLFLLSSLGGGSSAAAGESWSEFRGPTGQGHSAATGLPISWSPDKNVRWRVELPGAGWSSPVVVDQRIILTAAVALAPGSSTNAPTDYSLRAICLNADDGGIVWDRELFVEQGIDSPRIHSKNSHASPTPLVVDGKIYVHFGHEGSACLDMAGEIEWKSNELRYAPVHGAGGSPIAVGNRLIFNCDGASEPFVAALMRDSGQVAWRTRRTNDPFKKFSFSTPLAIEVRGATQIISAASDMVAAYEPETGAEIWRFHYDGYSVIPRPVYGNGLVYVATGYEQPTVTAIRVDGEGDVTKTHLAWSLKRGAPHTPSLVLVGDLLFMVADRGVATCCDARTGDIHWQERLEGNFSASPIHAEGRIYFQSEEGVGYVVAAAPKFQLIASNDLGERSLASYAVVNRGLLIRTAKHLYRIE